MKLTSLVTLLVSAYLAPTVVEVEGAPTVSNSGLEHEFEQLKTSLQTFMDKETTTATQLQAQVQRLQAQVDTLSSRVSRLNSIEGVVPYSMQQVEVGGTSYGYLVFPGSYWRPYLLVSGGNDQIAEGYVATYWIYMFKNADGTDRLQINTVFAETVGQYPWTDVQKATVYQGTPTGSFYKKETNEFWIGLDNGGTPIRNGNHFFKVIG